LVLSGGSLPSSLSTLLTYKGNIQWDKFHILFVSSECHEACVRLPSRSTLKFRQTLCCFSSADHVSGPLRFYEANPHILSSSMKVDERNVPHSSDESNLKAAREALLSKVPIPVTQVATQAPSQFDVRHVGFRGLDPQPLFSACDVQLHSYLRILSDVETERCGGTLELIRYNRSIVSTSTH
jgi:hypothetical protein